jgi:hypothetical protein
MPDEAPLHATYLGEPCNTVFARYEYEIESLRLLLTQTIVYLDARVSNKPQSRGFALLQRLNAALIRKD